MENRRSPQRFCHDAFVHRAILGAAHRLGDLVASGLPLPESLVDSLHNRVLHPPADISPQELSIAVRHREGQYRSQ